MQYVTYENLFTFSLVLIGIVGLVLEAVRTHKHAQKEIAAPSC